MCFISKMQVKLIQFKSHSSYASKHKHNEHKRSSSFSTFKRLYLATTPHPMIFSKVFYKPWNMQVSQGYVYVPLAHVLQFNPSNFITALFLTWTTTLASFSFLAFIDVAYNVGICGNIWSFAFQPFFTNGKATKYGC